jgi:hypothetical protein
MAASASQCVARASSVDIDHQAGVLMLKQPTGWRHLALHAQRHGLQPPQRQPAVEGPQDRALRVLRAPVTGCQQSFWQA